MSWKIQIPYRSSSDSLVDVAEACRELPTDESRDVARQIVLGELTNGSATTAGELLDQLEKASPAERRKTLDAARVEAGLPSIEDIEFAQKHEQVQRDARARAFNAPEPRYALNDSGLIVDLTEREQDAARVRTVEESLRRQRAERAAVQATAAAEARQHEQSADATFRDQHRHQLPWQAA